VDERLEGRKLLVLVRGAASVRREQCERGRRKADSEKIRCDRCSAIWMSGGDRGCAQQWSDRGYPRELK